MNINEFIWDGYPAWGERCWFLVPGMLVGQIIGRLLGVIGMAVAVIMLPFVSLMVFPRDTIAMVRKYVRT